MSKKLVIKKGNLDPSYISLLSNLSRSVDNNHLEVLNAVAYNREVGHFENAPNIKTWKRAIVSPKGSSFVFKLFFPRAIHRRLYYSYLPVNTMYNAYQVHQQLSNTDVRTLKSFAYGYLAGARTAQFWFIALERLTSVISYEEYAKKYITKTSDRSLALKQLITYVAKRLINAHNNGFYHEDIKPYHIYIDNGPDTIYQDPSLTSKWLWIDLDDAGVRKKIPYRRRIINLYQCWRYLLLPYGINKPDDFVSLYLDLCQSELPPKDTIIKDLMRHYTKRITKNKRSATLS